MTKQRFSTEQIVSVLKQAEMGLPVKDLIRQIGIATSGKTGREKRFKQTSSSPRSRDQKATLERTLRLSGRLLRPGSKTRMSAKMN